MGFARVFKQGWRRGPGGCAPPGLHGQSVVSMLNRLAYGRSMVNSGEVQVSQWAGLLESPPAFSTVITA